MSAERVEVREVGLRDGLQSIPEAMPSRDKLDWLAAEYGAGVRAFEAASFVPPALLPQMADAETVVRGARSFPDVEIAALVPNLKGALRAAEAGAHKLIFVVSASAAHNEANVRRTIAQSLEDFSRIAEAFAERPSAPLLAAGISTAFGCTIAGHVPPRDVCELASDLARRGARELTIADTVGYAGPREVRALFRRLRDELGPLPLAAHFHDTRGLGLVNVCAALEAGVRAFDSSLGGLGGCPHSPGATGNISTEDVAFLLAAEGFETGINLPRLLRVHDAVAELLPHVQFTSAIAKAGLPRTVAAA